MEQLTRDDQSRFSIHYTKRKYFWGPSRGQVRYGLARQNSIRTGHGTERSKPMAWLIESAIESAFRVATAEPNTMNLV